VRGDFGRGPRLTYRLAMAKTATKPVELRRKEQVVATVDLRGVPQGTAGVVTMVSGFTWVRYWVRFENGVAMGSISRAKLARPEEWARTLAGEEEPGAAGAGDQGAGDGAADAGEAGDGEADVTTSNGTVVPAKLIERAQRARARLTA
jgi:hypothetical protein